MLVKNKKVLGAIIGLGLTVVGIFSPQLATFVGNVVANYEESSANVRYNEDGAPSMYGLDFGRFGCGISHKSKLNSMAR